MTLEPLILVRQCSFCYPQKPQATVFLRIFMVKVRIPLFSGRFWVAETGQCTRITCGEFNPHFGGHTCTLEKSVFYKNGSYTRVLHFVISYKNCATTPSWRFGEISVDTRRKIWQIGPGKRLRHPYRWRYKNPVKSISIGILIPKGSVF